MKSQIITLSIESCIRQKYINHKKNEANYTLHQLKPLLKPENVYQMLSSGKLTVHSAPLKFKRQQSKSPWLLSFCQQFLVQVGGVV